MERIASITRDTNETQISMSLTWMAPAGGTSAQASDSLTIC